HLQLASPSPERRKGSVRAISYVWGDANALVGIICDGVHHQITVSLALALKTLRHPLDARTLWADAICINQKDEKEKGHQVQQMRMVYEKAKGVLVHFGPDDDRIAEDCFNLVRDFNIFWGPTLLQYGDPHSVPSSSSYPFSVDPKRWDTVVNMSKLPWFDRLWVVQEAGLAKSCYVLWGDVSIAFSEIIELILWFGCRADIRQQLCPQIDLKWSLIFSFNQCTLENTTTRRNDLPLCAWVSNYVATGNAETTFIEILRTCRDMDATDPRDHVYGVMGSPFARNGDEKEILEPNYSKSNSVADVFVDIAKALLQHPGEAAYLLGAVDHRSPVNILAEDGCPSWAPRWDQGSWTSTSSSPLGWDHAGGRKDRFHADFRHGNLLHVHCIDFDELSWISEPLQEGNLSLDPARWDIETQKSGKSPIDNLWETIVSSYHKDAAELDYAFMVTLLQEYSWNEWVETHGIPKSRHRSDFAEYKLSMRTAAAALKTANGATGISRSTSAQVVRFSERIRDCYNRHLAHTKDGRLLLTPRFAEPNDRCCVIPGLPAPLILRPSGVEGVYHLVGDCYIYGVMGGEIMQLMEEGKYQSRRILLK
ncbi:hypothetical protein K402DRAFT_322945, partial [Aulographum hederae CBS 113979]